VFVPQENALAAGEVACHHLPEGLGRARRGAVEGCVDAGGTIVGSIDEVIAVLHRWCA
jgi:hypothetical protein